MISVARNGPLAIRDFRLLAAGQAASTVGDYCYAVALPWYVLSSHGTAALLGIILTCYGIPRTMLIPVGGILADRFNPRAVMLFADVIRSALLALLVLLASRHTVSLSALGPTAALTGACEGLFIPASFALLPAVLGEGALTAGNALFSALQSVGALIGPAVGGAIVAVMSPAPVLAIDAVTFAISAMTLMAMRPPGSPSRSASQAPTGIGVLGLLRGSRVLQILIMIIIAANLTMGGLTEVAVPSLSHERFGASGFGVLLVCMAAGSITGFLGAGRTGGLRRPSLAASAAYLSQAAAMAVVPFLGGLWGASVAMTVMGVGIGLCNGIVLPRLQTWAPPALTGRVMGLVLLCSIGSAPLSVALTGVVVQRFGVSAFFPAAAAFNGVVFFIAIAFGEWRRFGSPPGTADSPT